MAMGYSEFKQFVLDFAWAKGDTVITDNLDNLITMAEHEIDAGLRVEARHQSANILVDALRIAVPLDFKHVIGISAYDTKLAEFKYISPSNMQSLRVRTDNSYWQPFYSIENGFLLFCGPAIDTRKTVGPLPPDNPIEGDLWFRTTVSPGLYIWNVDTDSSQWVQLTSEATLSQDATSSINVILDYHAKIPNFKATDQSWLADSYLHLYMYATLKNSSLAQREDERLPNWVNLYEVALEKANENSAFEQTRGTYGPMPLPRSPSVHRKRRR